jgi:hypothetical protein
LGRQVGGESGTGCDCRQGEPKRQRSHSHHAPTPTAPPSPSGELTIFNNHICNPERSECLCRIGNT